MKDKEKKTNPSEEAKPEKECAELTDEQLTQVTGGNTPEVVFEKPEEIDTSGFKFPTCY